MLLEANICRGGGSGGGGGGREGKRRDQQNKGKILILAGEKWSGVISRERKMAGGGEGGMERGKGVVTRRESGGGSQADTPLHQTPPLFPFPPPSFQFSPLPAPIHPLHSITPLLLPFTPSDLSPTPPPRPPLPTTSHLFLLPSSPLPSHPSHSESQFGVKI